MGIFPAFVQRGHAGTYCPLVFWAKLQFSFLLSSLAFFAMSPLAHLLGIFLDFIFRCCLLFTTQVKTQLEQNETLVEKEQVLRQKLALELEEVGMGKEGTRVCKAFMASQLLMKPEN